MHYDCNHGWSLRFKALYERYQHVIRFGFYGHEHDEWMQLYPSIRNPHEFIGMAYLVGSTTTYLNRNPNFSVVDLDQQYMVPINIHTHFFNISKAHDDPSSPQWEYLHDYRLTYNLTDMSPSSIYQGLALKVRDNEKAAILYQNYQGGSSPYKSVKRCRWYCRLDLFCQITAGEAVDYNVCLGYP